MLSKEDLKHNLPSSPAVFFVLRGSLSKPMFFELLTVLEDLAGSPESVSKERYWEGIRERFQGTKRWDTLVPRYSGAREGDYLIALNESLNNVENLPKHRPYASFVVDEVRYAIDMFNPMNELELPYSGAGEPVVTLLLGNAMRKWVPYPVPVRDRLKEIPSFYRIIDTFVKILAPEKVCGGFFIGRVMLAYQHAKENLPAEARPWDFLWTLNVLDPPRVNGLSRSDLERTFAKVLDLSNGQILLQVMPGLDSTMGREYTLASRLLKMKPVTEVELE